MLLINILKRGLSAIIAFAVGILIYFIALITDGSYDFSGLDGLVGFLIQCGLAFVINAIVVGFALTFQLILRFPVIKNFWITKKKWAIIIIMVCVLFLIFGYQFGFRETVIHPVTKAEVEIIDLRYALTAFFLIIFTITNWPMKK